MSEKKDYLTDEIIKEHQKLINEMLLSEPDIDNLPPIESIDRVAVPLPFYKQLWLKFKRKLKGKSQSSPRFKRIKVDYKYGS